jgi:HK97 gp10 family phage protein
VKASFKSSGFRALDRQLAKLAGGVPEQRKRDHLHAAGQIIVAEAKRLAPFATGTLRDSIMVTDDKQGLLYGKFNATGRSNSDGVSVYIGPVGSVDDGDVYYARFQEFGTINMQAQPYMRPAIAAKRPEAERALVQLLARDVMEMIR